MAPHKRYSDALGRGIRGNVETNIIGVKKRRESAGKSLKSKAKRCELADIVVQR